MCATRLLVVTTLLLGVASGAALAQTAKNSAQAMRDLRFAFLSSPASSLGFEPTKEYPRVFGVAMDWPIGEHTATIVTARDGSASLYTTATFGIIGASAAHDSVRAAALRFVKAAESHHDEAAPTNDYAYPSKGKVRFYLRTFDGARVIESESASVYSNSGRYAQLFRAGQAVVTELRKVAEQK
ncbi:MAG: hypothetical protein DME04_14480 [Candidatus Rokuibacteriota bacterium]|nr:MAG: hypothetical protein DME04_14480 [Candidatus Rokubacteria bacterium]